MRRREQQTVEGIREQSNHLRFQSHQDVLDDTDKHVQRRNDAVSSYKALSVKGYLNGDSCLILQIRAASEKFNVRDFRTIPMQVCTGGQKAAGAAGLDSNPNVLKNLR